MGQMLLATEKLNSTPLQLSVRVLLRLRFPECSTEQHQAERLGAQRQRREWPYILIRDIGTALDQRDQARLHVLLLDDENTAWIKPTQAFSAPVGCYHFDTHPLAKS